MRAFGLIGYPLSHSFSKKYFGEKFQKEGITDCSYELYPLPAIDALPQLLADVPGLEGLNVTIPYKEQVLPFLHHQTEVVRAIGACNCISIRNGVLTGYNTDVIGFRRSLEPLLQPHHQRALVLGTGGAAKAVQWVLQQLGVAVLPVSRSGAPGSISYQAITPQLLQDYTLLVNTTPLGMLPDITSKPLLPYASLTPHHLCYDLVYNPAKTAFLLAAERYGAVIKNGLEMLEIQAAESWSYWNGR